MSVDLGRGDWVECIGQPDGFAGPVIESAGAPDAGKLYVVEEIGAYGGQQFLNCYGLARPGECDPKFCWAPGWDIRGFRLIYKPRAEFIEALKAPPISAPVHEREDA